MTNLLSCQNITKTYGARSLFQDISFGLEERDHVGLVGPNGSGKSTFLKILAGLESPDTGTVAMSRGTRIGYLSQKTDFSAISTLEEAVLKAMPASHEDEFERYTKACVILGKMGFDDPTIEAATLSGGWKKRLALACVLASEPDLILMDEPTNHLDLEGILWLEKMLQSAPFAFLVVSHDRTFLENVTTKTVEISRRYPTGLFQVGGPYSEFLLNRESFLAGQERQEEALANRVRREVEWLRRGPKARTTKAQGRINEAERLMEDLEELKKRNEAVRSAALDFTGTGKKTKILFQAAEVQKKMGDRTLFADVNLVLSPGMRLGLVGPNGSGKTTFLRLINGTLTPDGGRAEKPPSIKVLTFDQSRHLTDTNVSLKRFMAPDSDHVLYRGRPIHVSSWVRRFLFDAKTLDMPLSRFSGGEQARILIARFMLDEADILLLDEPTNDLDIPTLEVLEESLMDFPGALVLVTHDRFFLDRVSNTMLGLDGQGGSAFYADYSQWERLVLNRKPGSGPSKKESKNATSKTESKRPQKLSYKEQAEWDQIEGHILKAEQKVSAQQAQVQDPVIATDSQKLQEACAELDKAQKEVERLYGRWEELSQKVNPT